MNYEDFITEERRLVILRRLVQAPAYTLDQTVLTKALALEGLAVSRDRLKTDLAWLAEQDLIVGQQPGGVWVATLTVRGLDVAQGLTVVPGVARPEPGE
ncbi:MULTISPECIES: VpaChn25_0724 family phage protein [Methylococcus]|uniref:VpaChn25_0724 family phage protein n=1 Tax=Methylococcus TaxID=413 RepID=UPI001C531DBE|nr:ArsR family transcriptional regulator [Methylococcus capsulatus]QXP93029.1 ArsR family transcriptional regulator [Methylococcus capsulatus]